MTYLVTLFCGGELQTLLCHRQRILERMELESQVGTVVSHNAPVHAGVRRTTPANVQCTTFGNSNSPAVPDDVTVFVVGTTDIAAPHHPAAPKSSTDLTKDADIGGRDDSSDASADLEPDAVAWRQQNEFGRLADDR